MWAVDYGGSGIVGLLIVGALIWFDVGYFDDVTGAWPMITGAAAGLLTLLGFGVIPFWRYRVHRWEVTDTAVYTQRGWLVQERRIAPVSRVQTVDTERGPLAQLFGLSTVTITTASAEGELRIEGLLRADADRLVSDLTATTAAISGDAT